MEIKIPIEIVELEDNSFHIIVSLQIGSIEGDFIIDTGASVTVIDKLTPFSYEPLDDVSEINSGGVCGEINEVQLVNITGSTNRQPHDREYPRGSHRLAVREFSIRQTPATQGCRIVGERFSRQA